MAGWHSSAQKSRQCLQQSATAGLLQVPKDQLEYLPKTHWNKFFVRQTLMNLHLAKFGSVVGSRRRLLAKGYSSCKRRLSNKAIGGSAGRKGLFFFEEFVKKSHKRHLKEQEGQGKQKHQQHQQRQRQPQPQPQPQQHHHQKRQQRHYHRLNPVLLAGFAKPIPKITCPDLAASKCAPHLDLQQACHLEALQPHIKKLFKKSQPKTSKRQGPYHAIFQHWYGEILGVFHWDARGTSGHHYPRLWQAAGPRFSSPARFSPHMLEAQKIALDCFWKNRCMFLPFDSAFCGSIFV